MPVLAPLQTRLQQIEQRLAPLARKSDRSKPRWRWDATLRARRLKIIEAQRARADAAALAVVGRG